jgi:hypothetical protein
LLFLENTKDIRIKMKNEAIIVDFEWETTNISEIMCIFAASFSTLTILPHLYESETNTQTTCYRHRMADAERDERTTHELRDMGTG